jgi:hypothetical protein
VREGKTTIIVANHNQRKFIVYKVCELECTRLMVGSCDLSMNLCTLTRKIIPDQVKTYQLLKEPNNDTDITQVKKVKLTLEQATKSQRRSTGIALPFL